MMLLTKEIIKKIPKLYSKQNIPSEAQKVIVKFFTPDAQWTWYVTEGEQQSDGDWLFFGLVHGFEKEWGYFTLNELLKIRGTLGLPIERDKYFGSPTIKEINK